MRIKLLVGMVDTDGNSYLGQHVYDLEEGWAKRLIASRQAVPASGGTTKKAEAKVNAPTKKKKKGGSAFEVKESPKKEDDGEIDTEARAAE